MATDFESVLSEKRNAVPTPPDIADENGNCYFGTFDKEFETMDFLKVNKPSVLPNKLNRMRLTLWEAAEVNFGKYVLLTAVCKMPVFGTALTVVYNTETKKCTAWQEMLPPQKAVISENLLRGAETKAETGKTQIRFINDFQRGEAIVSGFGLSEKKGDVSYRLNLKRVSKPSVVNIPFGDNKPLYTQKDLFKVEGYLEVNGERLLADENTLAIIDDHRGYYPRHSHYDWVTTMCRLPIDGKEQYFGFNLTRNQSVNQDQFNENLIWFENNSTLLTPVTFTHETPLLWHIKDEHGMVDLTFDIGDEFVMKFNFGVMQSDYHITFGSLTGYLCDPKGNKYVLNGVNGVGEDKTVVF